MHRQEHLYHADSIKPICFSDDDIMKLVARTDLHQAKGDVWDEFVEHLKTPFRPLTPGAWALIFATIIVAGFGLSFIEPSALAFEWRQVTPEVLNESIQSQEDDGVQLEWQVPDATFADRMNVRCGIPIFHIVSKKLTELVGSMYYGSLGLIAGSPIHESDSMPGRLLTVGFGFFCLVCLSSYTASLATLLMMANQRVSTITSLDDVIASGEPLCIRGAMLDNFLATYPEFDQTKLLAFDTQSDCSLDVRGCQDGLIDAGDQMLNALDAEKCVGVVIFSDAWESKKRSGFHCNKAAVNNLFGVPSASSSSLIFPFCLSTFTLYFAFRFCRRNANSRRNCGATIVFDCIGQSCWRLLALRKKLHA
eukprot:SAG31_NODE_419_length_15872_cov_21.857985_6_plen_364_part_00